MTEPELPVNQIFYGYQWEGQHMGRHALYVRLQGCPLQCKPCPMPSVCEVGNEVPVDYILNKSQLNEPDDAYAVVTVSQLVMLIEDLQDAPYDIVIIGGEPATHDLFPLSVALDEMGYTVTIQTAGELPFNVIEGTRISVRPRSRQVIPEVLHAADEVLFIVRDAGDLAHLDVLMEHVDDDHTEVFLQPVPNDLRAMQFCMDLAPDRGFRLSYRPDQLIE